MKIVFLLFAFSLVLFQKSFAQILHQPASIVYNESNSTYYIANAGCGEILGLDEKGIYTVFAKGLSAEIQDMEILDDKLYICDGAMILAYHIQDGSLLFKKNINAKSLQGLTSQGDYLFATDPISKKIYRISATTGASTVFIQNTQYTPTSIHYDLSSHSLLYLTDDNPSKMMRVDMITKELSLIQNFTDSKMSSLCKNNIEQYALASKTDGNIYIYSTDFSTPLDTLSFPDLAAVCYNEKQNILAVVTESSPLIKFVAAEDIKASALHQLNTYPNLHFYFDRSKNKVSLKDTHNWTQYYAYDIHGNSVAKGYITENEFELQISQKGIFIIKCTTDKETGVFKMYKF